MQIVKSIKEGNYKNPLYVQQISNGVIRDAYKIKTNKEAILSENNGTASIVVGDKEYYDYVMFEDDYAKRIKAAVENSEDIKAVGGAIC